MPKIFFPPHFAGPKTVVPSIASECKKTKITEAEAKKRKTSQTAVPPPEKRLKTKKAHSSSQAQVPPAPSTTTLSAQEEPLLVMPISVAPPASENTERHVILHEPAPTEAHAKESEVIPAVDNTAAADIGHEDNVQPDPEIIPQIEAEVVASPPHEASENISIGDPSTPIIQDEFWEEEHAHSPMHEVIPHSPPAQAATPVFESPLESIEVEPTAPQASPF